MGFGDEAEGTFGGCNTLLSTEKRRLRKDHQHGCDMTEEMRLDDDDDDDDDEDDYGFVLPLIRACKFRRWQVY